MRGITRPETPPTCRDAPFLPVRRRRITAGFGTKRKRADRKAAVLPEVVRAAMAPIVSPPARHEALAAPTAEGFHRSGRFALCQASSDPSSNFAFRPT